MDDDSSRRIAVGLTIAEAELVIAALRQYEPYWPAGLDAAGRARLLAEVRGSVQHLIGSLEMDVAFHS